MLRIRTTETVMKPQEVVTTRGLSTEDEVRDFFHSCAPDGRGYLYDQTDRELVADALMTIATHRNGWVPTEAGALARLSALREAADTAIAALEGE